MQAFFSRTRSHYQVGRDKSNKASIMYEYLNINLINAFRWHLISSISSELLSSYKHFLYINPKKRSTQPMTIARIWLDSVHATTYKINCSVCRYSLLRFSKHKYLLFSLIFSAFYLSAYIHFYLIINSIKELLWRPYYIFANLVLAN